MEKLQSLGIGLTGMVGSGTADYIVNTAPVPVSDIMSVITQVIIGIATLISLFRKKKGV